MPVGVPWQAPILQLAWLKAGITSRRKLTGRGLVHRLNLDGGAGLVATEPGDDRRRPVGPGNYPPLGRDPWRSRGSSSPTRRHGSGLAPPRRRFGRSRSAEPSPGGRSASECDGESDSAVASLVGATADSAAAAQGDGRPEAAPIIMIVTVARRRRCVGNASLVPPALGGRARRCRKGSCGPVSFGGASMNDIATLAVSSRKVKQFLIGTDFAGCARRFWQMIRHRRCRILAGHPNPKRRARGIPRGALAAPRVGVRPLPRTHRTPPTSQTQGVAAGLALCEIPAEPSLALSGWCRTSSENPSAHRILVAQGMAAGLALCEIPAEPSLALWVGVRRLPRTHGRTDLVDVRHGCWTCVMRNPGGALAGASGWCRTSSENPWAYRPRWRKAWLLDLRYGKSRQNPRWRFGLASDFFREPMGAPTS